MIQNELYPRSILNSGFSSWEFHSIEEFSKDQSSITIRKMDFDKPISILDSGKKPEFKRETHKKAFEYKPRFANSKPAKTTRNAKGKLKIQESSRRVVNVFNASSYEKSVEVTTRWVVQPRIRLIR